MLLQTRVASSWLVLYALYIWQSSLCRSPHVIYSLCDLNRFLPTPFYRLSCDVIETRECLVSGISRYTWERRGLCDVFFHLWQVRDLSELHCLRRYIRTRTLASNQWNDNENMYVEGEWRWYFIVDMMATYASWKSCSYPASTLDGQSGGWQICR